MIDKAQREVLSHIILNPKSYYHYYTIMSEELFSDTYKSVYRLVSESFKDGRKPDLFAMNEQFGDFMDYILTTHCDDFDSALIFLIDKKNEKIVRDAALRITNSDVEDAVKVMENAIFQIKDIGNDSKLANLNLQAESFLDKVSRIGEGITGLRTDYYQYDIFTSGLQKKELIVVAGETSQGKTSFAMTMMYNVAVNGAKALILSLEMSVDQMLARIVSQMTGINSKRILNRNCTEGQIEDIKDAVAKIKTMPLIIHECHSANMGYIMDTIRAYKIVRDIDVVMLDYLQLVSNHGRNMSKEQQVGDVVRRLKNITLELDIPIICLSQLSRNKENPLPTLARLRDSGQIEEAADQVIFIYRPECYGKAEFDDGMPANGKADIIIAKGRNIGTTKFRMDFIPGMTLFRNEQEYEFPKPIINSDYEKQEADPF